MLLDPRVLTWPQTEPQKPTNRGRLGLIPTYRPRDWQGRLWPFAGGITQTQGAAGPAGVETPVLPEPNRFWKLDPLTTLVGVTP